MKNLKALRGARKMTQEQCAEAFGVTVQKWARWENLKHKAPEEMQYIIADYFQVTPEQLRGRAPFEVTTDAVA